MTRIKKFVRLRNFSLDFGFTYDYVYLYDKLGYNVNMFKDLTENIYKYNPTKGDKIYFYPDCTVPRFKLTTYHEKHGTSSIRDADKADARFISEKYIQKLVNNISYMYAKDKQMFIAFLRKYFMNYESTLELITNLEQCEGEHVYYQYRVTGDMSRVINTDYHPDDVDTENTRRVFINEQDVALVESLFKDNKLYDQDQILKDINSGNVMDGNMYHSIKRLFKSEDKKDHKVGIECMANCDYTKSCVYLLLLLKEFGNTIYDNPARNQVNFKALLNFFNLSNYDMRRMSLDNIMSKLIDKKLLSKANLDLLMPLAMENCHTPSDDHFKVTCVEPTEDVIKATEESILNKDCDTLIFAESEEQINPHLD